MTIAAAGCATKEEYDEIEDAGDTGGDTMMATVMLSGPGAPPLPHHMMHFGLYRAASALRMCVTSLVQSNALHKITGDLQEVRLCPQSWCY